MHFNEKLWKPSVSFVKSPSGLENKSEYVNSQMGVEGAETPSPGLSPDSLGKWVTVRRDGRCDGRSLLLRFPGRSRPQPQSCSTQAWRLALCFIQPSHWGLPGGEGLPNWCPFLLTWGRDSDHDGARGQLPSHRNSLRTAVQEMAWSVPQDTRVEWAGPRAQPRHSGRLSCAAPTLLRPANLNRHGRALSTARCLGT